MCIARTQPIEYPEYPKALEETHLFQMDVSNYAFEDETGFLLDGYKSIEEAKAAYYSYFEWLTYGPNATTGVTHERV